MLTNLVFAFGLVGWFLAAFLANTVIPFPFETLLLAVKYFGGVVEVWLVVAALGAVLGESVMYAVGMGGHDFYGYLHKHANSIRTFFHLKKKKKRNIKSFARNKTFKRFGFWVKKHGMLTLFVAALTPLPMILFDLIAGYYEYDFKKFFTAVFLGKLIRYGLVVYLGIMISGLL